MNKTLASMIDSATKYLRRMDNPSPYFCISADHVRDAESVLERIKTQMEYLEAGCVLDPAVLSVMKKNAAEVPVVCEQVPILLKYISYTDRLLSDLYIAGKADLKRGDPVMTLDLRFNFDTYISVYDLTVYDRPVNLFTMLDKADQMVRTLRKVKFNSTWIDSQPTGVKRDLASFFTDTAQQLYVNYDTLKSHHSKFVAGCNSIIAVQNELADGEYGDVFTKIS